MDLQSYGLLEQILWARWQRPFTALTALNVKSF